jgi:hypothetical protein
MGKAHIRQAAISGRQISAADDSASALAALFAPLDHLLAGGGDARLQLSRERLNGYGCRPWPRPEAFTFASSTATSISARAYARASDARDELMKATLTQGLDAAFDARLEQMRAELKQHLLLDEATEIVFSPSGTDSQLHALFIARALMGTPLVNVIAASDQTGSGTVHTAKGCHFNNRTAQGVAVEKSAPVEGMTAGVSSIEIPLRGEDGTLRSPEALDSAIIDAVSTAIGNGAKVLLQIMNSSKLGLCAPSEQCVRDIRARWPQSVQVIVDACQMRLGRARIKHYLDAGHMILLTGSKFFTGPPFSGALLVPPQSSERLATISDVPSGLRDYTNRSDWPRNWQAIRAQLPARRNFGQWLRWEAALEEMRAYYAVPADFRRSTFVRFADAVQRILVSSPNLELLSFAQAPDGIDDEEMSARTIFPFAIRHGSGFLPFDDCTKIYRALNRDVSYLVSTDASAREKQLAAQLCHIGQPVALREDMAALRISAGARVVSETRSPDKNAADANVQREIDQVATICEKIKFLVAHLNRLDTGIAA